MDFPTKFDPLTDTADPALFYVIGKRLDMEPAADNAADRLLLSVFSELMFGRLLYAYAPDGLIVQHDGQCCITSRGELAPFNPASTQWTATAKAQPAPEPDRREWREIIEQAGLEFAADPRHSSHLARG